MKKVKIINTSKNPLPMYETEGAAGMDLRTNESDFTLFIGERKLCKTGLFMEIPKGYEMQIRPRSGLAFKQGLTVLNSPGTIDSDYRGEIGILVINHGLRHIHIKKGDRIAQGVFKKVERAVFEVVENIEETKRGKGGYGSTGK